jgi:acetoin utilization deacetylase AcuC-like enzyme
VGVAGFVRPKIVFSERCLEYGSFHIENPRRVRRAFEMLMERGYEFVEPEPAGEEDLLRVHDPEYIQLLRSGDVGDADTPAYEDIYEYARLSAGGAILAAEINGFSLMRPPGHHAGRFGAALGAATKGFCYINNIAVAVRRLDRRTLILDIDGHHGNGTQEIFLGDPRVVYVSLHRHPLYPGTGYYSELNCLNFPLPAECGEAVYIKTLEEALKRVDMGEIEVIAVSSGFDAFAGDLASLGLTEKAYGRIGEILASLGKPTFFVLEGGYMGENVGKAIDHMLKNFEGPP